MVLGGGGRGQTMVAREEEEEGEEEEEEEEEVICIDREAAGKQDHEAAAAAAAKVQEEGSLQYHDDMKNNVVTAEKLLRQAQHLLTIVASQASLVKAFLGKWMIITPRLLKLPALLNEMARLRYLSDNTVCKELLQVNHHRDLLHTW
jgi:hypothetical protein